MKDGSFSKECLTRHLHQMVGLANKLHVSILNAIVNHLRGVVESQYVCSDIVSELIP